MGNIKKHNRTLPLHPEPQAEKLPPMVFFEQIIRDEVDKVIDKNYSPKPVHTYPDMTTDLGERIHRVP